LHNQLEIEVKFCLSEVDAARKRILAMGATSGGRFLETNIRFEDGTKSLKAQGILLRLRKDNRTTLTLKSRPSEPDKDFKVHRELEVQVDDFDTCRAILEGLGFSPEQIYEKWRETFSVGDTKLLIDTTPYGVLLEIEGQRSDIRNIADQLELKWQERILLNYLEIFEIVRQEQSLPFNDMTFDNFKLRPVDIAEYLPLLYAG
jgi:adenylate cyclase class 2